MSSQETTKYDEVLLSWKWLNICLLVENSELIPYFALLAHRAFALPIKLTLSQTLIFLHFPITILSPSHREGASKWLCGAQLPAGVNRYKSACDCRELK